MFSFEVLCFYILWRALYAERCHVLGDRTYSFSLEGEEWIRLAWSKYECVQNMSEGLAAPNGYDMYSR